MVRTGEGEYVCSYRSFLFYPPHSDRYDVMGIKIGSFFSGAGGLDTGFHNVGFDVVWANEFDKRITPTLKANFPETVVDDRSLFDVKSEEVPDGMVGLIGGPSCQSWSIGGLGKGLNDPRGAVFLEYIRVIKAKQPLFFLAENVKGMLAKTRAKDLQVIMDSFDDLGYNLSYTLVNANNYGVPQDRWRVFFVGYRKDLGKTFVFPEPDNVRLSLKDAISDLDGLAVPALALDKPDKDLLIPNHEYSTGTFSSQYMSRNRVRLWDEPSFTIQASGRQAPLHPSSGLMVKEATDVYRFGNVNYRRLSVREAARIQTFPDTYKFIYPKLELGYKMIGNAVPVKLAQVVAEQIKIDLSL